MTGATHAVVRAVQDPPNAANSKERLRLGPLENMIGFHLRLAQAASFHTFAHRLDGVDVSPGWFAVLALISANPGITQTALSRADTRDKSSLTPILNQLERRRLISRERLDRRSYALNLTSAGATLLSMMMKQAEAHEHDLDQIVGPERKRDFIILLRRLADALS